MRVPFVDYLSYAPPVLFLSISLHFPFSIDVPPTPHFTGVALPSHEQFLFCLFSLLPLSLFLSLSLSFSLFAVNCAVNFVLLNEEGWRESRTNLEATSLCTHTG